MLNTDPNHKHTYNEQGEMTCCSLEEKINKEAEDHAGHDHSRRRIHLTHVFTINY